MKDRKNTVVAGLQVNGGKLKSGGSSHKYAYKVVRNGQIILEENLGNADLKRFKDSVNEVSNSRKQLMLGNDSLSYDYLFYRLNQELSVVCHWRALLTSKKEMISSATKL